MRDFEFHSSDPQPSLLQTMINQSEKDIELTTLRERVRELEGRLADQVSLTDAFRVSEANFDEYCDKLKSRIRDLEEAMPDVKTIEKISNEFGNDVGDHDHFFYVLRKMASRIESVMTKQPSEK